VIAVYLIEVTFVHFFGEDHLLVDIGSFQLILVDKLTTHIIHL